MQNLFGPAGSAVNPLGQAQQSRDMIIDMFAPKNQVNMDDPDSIRKEAARLMSDGQTEKGIRMNQLAEQVKARQEEGRANNIYATLGQVEGTAQEAQVREALIKAGRKDDIDKYDQEKMQEEMLGIKYEDAKRGAASKKALALFRSARTDEAKRDIYEKAEADGIAQHIDAFVEKERELKWKEEDRKWTQTQRQETLKQREVSKVRLSDDPAVRQKQIQQYESSGMGDMLRQRYSAYDQYRQSTIEALGAQEMGTRILTVDDQVFVDSRVSESEYEARARQFGRSEANRYIIEQAAAVRSSNLKADKTPTAKEVEYWETYLDDTFDTGLTDFSGSIDNSNVDTKMWAYEIAYGAKNNIPPSETLKRLTNGEVGIELDEESAQVAVQQQAIDDPELREDIQYARDNGWTWAQIYEHLSK